MSKEQLSLVENTRDLIKKVTGEMLESDPKTETDEIVNKAMEAVELELKASESSMDMDAIREMIKTAVEDYLRKADEPKDEEEMEAKPGGHEDEYKALRSELEETKATVANLVKAADDAQMDSRKPAASGVVKLLSKGSSWKTGYNPDYPDLVRWKELPTRAGLGEAMGAPLVKKGGEFPLEVKQSSLAATSIEGSLVQSTDLWRTLVDVAKISPQFRSLKVLGSSYKLTRIRDVSFAERASVNPSSDPTSAANAIEEDVITVKSWYASFPASLESLEDNTGAERQIEAGLAEQMVKTLDGECFRVLKAGAQASNVVKTGSATGLPAQGAVWARLIDLRASTPMPYRSNGVFFISTALESLLLKDYREGEGYSFSPFAKQSGVHTLLGHDVIVSDSFEDGNAANEVSAAFGDWSRAGVVGERINFVIWNDSLQPGYQLWQARFRAGVAMESLDAYAVLQTAA